MDNEEFPELNEFGKNVRKIREKRKMTQEQLAEAAKISQTTIDKIERGLTKRSRFAGDIARALGVSVDDLIPNSNKAGLIDTYRQTMRSPWSAETAPKMEMFFLRNKIQGNPQKLTEAPRAEPLGTLGWPPFIPIDAEAYAVIISHQSLEPEFEPGDVAYVNPSLPPIDNVTCIFMDDYNDHGDGVVRRLVSFDADYWTVTQFRPPQEPEKLSRKEFPICHRIVGRYIRR